AIPDPTHETFTNVTVNWGDLTSDTLSIVNRTSPVGGPTTALLQDTPHTYADNGDYIVTITAFDDNGGQFTPQQFTIHVDNVAPFVDLTGPTVVDEGTSYNWSLGPVVDPGADTVTSYVVHWGDGNTDTYTAAQIAGMGNLVGHTYADGANNYTIKLD